VKLKMLKPRRGTLPDRISTTPKHQHSLRHTSRSKWDKLRARILYRDGGLCQTCKREGRIRPATQVDHVVAVSNGGTDDEANLAAICTPCHKTKTKAEGGRG
jgi:5-methylcytosine-specific restriction protein A